MDILLGLVVLLVILLITHYLLRIWTSKSMNLPPGPVGLPVVGYSYSLGRRAHLTFMKLKLESYPDVMRIYFGQEPMVFLNSYEAIKEALQTKGDNFAGRQRNMLADSMNLGDGIISSEGPFWREHRRFALRTLRDFGFGRNKSETIVQNEVQTLMQFIDKEISQGRSEINDMDLLLRSVSNVICTLTMGEQPGYEDDGFMSAVNNVRENISRSLFTAPMVMFPTVFQKLSFFLSIVPRSRRMLRNLKRTLGYLQTKIVSHEDKFDCSQEPQDFIDTFLLEKQKLDTTKGDDHTFTAGELRREMFELFIAGTDTTSNSLSWGLLLLAIHPDIQEKCHAEIDATVGRERMVTMRDKESLQYIQAILDEVQRIGSIVPMGLIHRNFEADTIQGYHIPANTFVVPFVYGVHHDPRVWEKPDEFYPEHFLQTDQESGSVKYRSRPELIPFLIGKRECLGESLARTELFVFFVSLLQKYRVRLPQGEKRSIDELLLGSDGVVRSPVPHKLVFQQR